MIKFFGECVQNLITSVKYICSGRMRTVHAIEQAVSISWNSLPIILAVISITAAVITIQISKQFLMTGAETYVGGTLLIILLREIAPGFTALAVGARAGTAISAEIANMQVTSQIDAIKTLKVDPVGYYFAPRILAAGITIPMTVIIAEVIGLVAGMWISNLAIDLHPARFWESVKWWLATRDFYISIFKGFIFGILVALVCATQGYNTRGGAKEVGISTTQAAIKSTIYMLVADFLINLIFYI